ncbi:MAG: hypothetical protein JJU35_12975 [Balneolales bacterium]|nr:hypothetical protein [Balneolales bacterium]
MNPNSLPQNPEDDRFMQQLLRKSAEPMPFPDFDDEVMSAITALEAEAVVPQKVPAIESSAAEAAIAADYREELRRMRTASLRLSWLFFLIGLAAGIALLLSTPSYNIGFLGFQGREAWILIQGICLIWLLMQADQLLLLTKEYLSGSRYSAAKRNKRSAA